MEILNQEKLEWRNGQFKINDLIPTQTNPRKISRKQIADLKKSLTIFGVVEIPAVNLDGTVIAGQQRLHCLQLMGKGEEMVDVRIPNRLLTKEEAERYMLASNALGGSWDVEKLKIFSQDFLVDIGFDPIVISDVFEKKPQVEDDNFDLEKEIKKIIDPTTKKGDLIVLGPHRLICGDSRDLETVKRLVGTEKVSMCYSDPPYNISLDYNAGIGGKQSYGGSVIDNRTDEEYKDFIRKSMECALAVTNDNAHFFYWTDQRYIWVPQTLYAELGIESKRVCLWIKNGQSPVPGVAFNKCYEPCTYGVKGKPYLAEDMNDLNEVINKKTTTGNALHDQINDILLSKRLSGKEYEHATSKPPDLHQKSILRCTKPDDIILDSFGGSGSTLIAAEQLKRRAFLVEYEPVFCDLIIRRYEKLTGIKSKVITTYEENSEIKALY